MKITKHGQERLQQRGRILLDALVIKKYGECRQNGIYMLSRRRARQVLARLRRWLSRNKDKPSLSLRVAQTRKIISRLEKVVDWVALFSKEGDLITTYPASKRRQRAFTRGQFRPVYH